MTTTSLPKSMFGRWALQLGRARQLRCLASAWAKVSYEVLCGHRPFGRERFDVEYQTRLQPAPVDMTALHDVGISQACFGQKR